jgi:F0F1-type ATP synthase assembly protein I
MRLSSAAFQMIALLVVCTYGGYKLDELLISTPWATLSCSLLGVFLGLYILIKEAIKSSNQL